MIDMQIRTPEQKERHRIEQRKWSAKNRDKVKAWGKKWRDANPEKLKAITKKYRDTSPKYKILARKGHLKRYGITIKEYDVMLKKQKKNCKICNKKKRLFIDHCHNSKKVRALLCVSCNIFVGYIETYPHLLKKIIKYVNSN